MSFRKPMPVRRTAPGRYDESDGLWKEGQEEQLSVPMSVQPLKPAEMESLPEGRRGSRAVKIYAGAELLAADQDAGQEPDVITWLGKQWEVVGCDPNQGGVLPHYKAYAVEVKAN